jgi:hypothetical protein
MTEMKLYERGRITGMPGTKTTVTLYPQTLSVRMRNSVLRMIENRLITGGYASKARQIAEAMSEKYGLQVSTTNYVGVRVIGMSAEAAPRVKELLQADWTALILERPEYRDGYYHSRHIQSMAAIDACEPNFFLSMHDNVTIRKVTEILAEHTTQKLRDRTKQVADMLRGTEPIQLITF